MRNGLLALFMIVLSFAAAAQTRPPATARLLLCEPAANAPGKALALVRVDFPPSADSPAHHHAGVVGAVVIAGVVRSQLRGGAVIDYKAGEAFYEPVGAVHAVAENPSTTEPAALIAAFITDEGCRELTVPESTP